jgi:hypothetical protein
MVICQICGKNLRASEAFYRHFDNKESSFCSMKCVKMMLPPSDDKEFVLCEYDNPETRDKEKHKSNFPEHMVKKYKWLRP